MNSIELAPQEIPKTNERDEKLRKLVDGPASSNYNIRQIQLVAYKLVAEKPETILDHDTLDEACLNWANSKYSEAFSKIARGPSFKDHPRFQGDIKNINLEDVQYMVDKGEMPE